MDDDDEKDDSKRKSRNLSEKKRRDQFNMLVNELSSMVSAANRKMDKSTVLKSTISFLKNHNEVAVRSKIHEIREDWKPSFLSNEEFTHLILEALDGFIIVFAANGRIYYASESITSLLGHLPSDLLNMSIYDLAFEDDHSDLYNLLLNPPSIVDPVQDSITNENQVYFSCHVKRGGLNFREEITYELVEFVGYFRRDLDIENIAISETKTCGFVNDMDSKLIFVGTSRIHKPQFIREMSIIGSSKSEFTSRHSLEWKFLFLDHRAPPIIGYLPFEVLGTSGYDYYHFDDLEQVLLSHESLKQKGEGTSCFYRFLTKGQQWIWIQTRYYITYHQWTSKPEFIVCTHRVINYQDAMQQLRSNSRTDADDSNVDDSTDSVERQLNTSASSMMITTNSTSSSSWAGRRAKAKLASTPANKSRQRHHTYHGSASLDLTYLSVDTPSTSSRYSSTTVCGTKTKLRAISQSLKTSPHHFNYHSSQPAQSATINATMSTQQQQQQQRALSASIPSFTAPAPLSMSTAQYLTAIPVQTVLPQPFPSTAVISTMPNQIPDIIHPSIVMSSSQTFLQDQLQRKHEELQQLIVHQQDELRRVSEQLVMARYGLPLVNVALPFTTASVTIPTTVDTGTMGENRKIFGHNEPLHELHSTVTTEHLASIVDGQLMHDPRTHHHSSVTTGDNNNSHQSHLQHQQQQEQQLHHHHQHQHYGILQSHQEHLHHNNSQYHQLVEGTHLISDDAGTDASHADEIISYMQLTPVSTVHHEYSHLLLRETTDGNGVDISDTLGNTDQENEMLLHHHENCQEDMS